MKHPKYERLLQIYAADLPSRAVSDYHCLFQHMNQEMGCFPAISTICEETGLSRSTVKRSLNDLMKAGFLRKTERYRTNGSQTSNLYRLELVSSKEMSF